MSINEQAIGIHIIQGDKPGSFPRILANLSGLQFETPGCVKGYKIPSFHYSRYQNCTYGKKQSEKYFYYTADITLEEQKNEIKDNEDAIGAVVLSLPSPGKQKNEIKKEEEAIGDDEIKYINKLLFNSDSNDKLGPGLVNIGNGQFIDLIQDGKDVDHKESVYKLLTQNCTFQVTTSPETYRAKLFNLLKNWDFFGDPEFKKKDAERETKRAYIDTTFSYSKEISNVRPFAKLYLCCRYGDRPGALAAAINTLLFKKWDNSTTQNKDRIFNIMFYMDYFSFASGVAYDAIYGRLECNNKIISKEQSKDVIERILICPITEDTSSSSSWYDEYAIKLYCFLNAAGYEYQIEPKQENVQNNQNIPNILIYRNGSNPCEIIKKKDGEDERCPNKGCDICRKYWWPLTDLNPQFRNGSV